MELELARLRTAGWLQKTYNPKTMTQKAAYHKRFA
jgi:hypothetical protein